MISKRAILMLNLAALLMAPPSAPAAATNVVIDIGQEEPGAELGRGWGRREQDPERTFIWMRRLEADVWVELHTEDAAEIVVRAAPLFVPRRAQRIGLYVNGRFIAQWDCPHVDQWRFEDYTAEIGPGILKSGRNRITLRAGYCLGEDGAGRAVAVDRIEIRPRGWL